MKRIFLSLGFCLLAIWAVAAFIGFGQEQQPPLKGYTTVRPAQGLTQAALAGFLNNPVEIPMWTYSVTAAGDLGGGNYSGTMLGRSPFLKGKTTTTINLQIVPLHITITDVNHGAVVYDSGVTDPCITTPANTSDVTLIQQSPIFTNNNWTMNGVNVGNTQYIDAFQRASFWSLLGGTSYHLILNPTILPVQNLNFNSSQGQNWAHSDVGGSFFPCGGFLGVIDVNAYDAAIQALISGPLAGTVNINTFPIFVSHDVVNAEVGHSIFSNCCILGYHSGIVSGANLQLYSPLSLETAGIFNADTETIAHEMGEAVDDPTGNNATPFWGGEGQVSAGSCQNNLEVGDPLSEGFATPTAKFTVVGANGFTYHLQEMAFFSWFFGGTSLGSGGRYSNNGTFTGYAKQPCPPGGTH